MLVIKRERWCPRCKQGFIWSHTDNDGTKPEWCEVCGRLDQAPIVKIAVPQKVKTVTVT